METEYGFIEHITEDQLKVGELVVTEYGVELEVVSVDPLKFEIAPMEAEDWGE